MQKHGVMGFTILPHLSVAKKPLELEVGLIMANQSSPEGVAVCHITTVLFEFRPGCYSELN